MDRRSDFDLLSTDQTARVERDHGAVIARFGCRRDKVASEERAAREVAYPLQFVAGVRPQASHKTPPQLDGGLDILLEIAILGLVGLPFAVLSEEPDGRRAMQQVDQPPVTKQRRRSHIRKDGQSRIDRHCITGSAGLLSSRGME